MQKNNWKLAHALEKPRQVVMSPLAASQSQTNFKMKDRFTHSHGSGGFYRECISTGTNFFNGQGPMNSRGSQWSHNMTANSGVPAYDQDNIN